MAKNKSNNFKGKNSTKNGATESNSVSNVVTTPNTNKSNKSTTK